MSAETHCPTCDQPLVQVSKHWICPQHGQIPARSSQRESAHASSAVSPQEGMGASSQTLQALVRLRIDKAIEHGFVLLPLRKASLKDQYYQQESLYALEEAATSSRSNIVPVVVSSFRAIKESFPPSLMFALGGLQWLDLSIGPLDELIAALIKYLKTREMV